jgi:hypothetical protein
MNRGGRASGRSAEVRLTSWRVKKGFEPMRSNRLTTMLFILMAVMLIGPFSTLSLRAEEKTPPPGKTAEEFFIVSSVDLKQKQMVLKRPTEVTELIQTTDKTVYLDEEGKKIQFEKLRAGDTVWVFFSGKAEGARIASVVRKGPMTTEELHRRYVKFD